MNVWVYSFCWNEEKILPYFLRHYGQFCQKMVLYDNGSSDESQKIIQAAPQAELRHYDSGGQFRDDLKLELANNCWKEARGQADYVVVCDIDEFLYHPSIQHCLKGKKAEGFTCIIPRAFHMVSDRFPTTPGQITTEVKNGVYSEFYSKPCLFDPNAIEEMNYELGCHKADPTGRVKINHAQWHLKLLHYQYLGFDYLVWRHQRYRKRLSDFNLENGCGIQYLETNEERLVDFQEMQAQATPVI